MLHRVPFYSQHWNLDLWESLGFKSRDEALYWQNSSCGILCLKMAIEGIMGRDIGSTSDIIRKGELLGAYSHKAGWSHNGLVKLARNLGVSAASSREHMTRQNLKGLLDDGCLIIVSTTSAFEPKNKTLKERLLFWKKFGGHLALVIGYDKEGFRIHHTSIREGYNWENATISFDKFGKAFTRRGVVISAS